MKPKILFLGFGKLGRAFHRLFDSEYEIRGIRRNPDPDEPASVIGLPIGSEAVLPHLNWSEIVVFSPSSGGGDLDHYKNTYLGNLTSVIGRIRADSLPVRLFILIGSTGVYPKEQSGVWTEEAELPSESSRQEVLVATEQALIESGLDYVILRCGGLYGEGRGNFGRIRRAGKARTSEMTGEFLPLIHQEDVCRVIHRVIGSGRRKEIYNLVDDSDLSRKKLYSWFADETWITIEDDGPAPVGHERFISNAKLKRDLGYELISPRLTDFLKARPASEG